MAWTYLKIAGGAVLPDEREADPHEELADFVRLFSVQKEERHEGEQGTFTATWFNLEAEGTAQVSIVQELMLFDQGTRSSFFIHAPNGTWLHIRINPDRSATVEIGEAAA